MKKIFDTLVEFIFWLAIFGSPFLTCFAIAAIIYSSHENLRFLSIVIITIGFIGGILLAEKSERSMVVQTTYQKYFLEMFTYTSFKLVDKRDKP